MTTNPEAPTPVVLGHDERVGQDLTIDATDLERHMLVVGPTGTGKTTFCAGMVGHAIDLGWQVLVVDGKGDGVLAGAVAALAGDRGRKVLAVDFNKPDGPSINPFTDLPADDVAEIVASPLTDSGADSVWKARARQMTNVVVGAVSDLAGKNQEVDIPGLAKWFSLASIVEMATDENLSENHRKQVEAYLSSLPGYQKDKGVKQGPTTHDQHGYLQMQLSEPLRVLGSRYGHVFKADGAHDLGKELEVGTVVTITCPAISRSDDDMRIIGSVMTAYVRSIATMRAGLNAAAPKVTVAEGLDLKPKSVKPLLILFDELESYVVESLVPVVSMGRSLGLRLVFATQEMPEEGSRGPMATVARNTGIKVFKKADDARAWRLRTRTNGADESDQVEALQSSLARHDLLQRALRVVGDHDKAGIRHALTQAQADVETATSNLSMSTVDLVSPLTAREAIVYDWRYRRIVTPTLVIGDKEAPDFTTGGWEASVPEVGEGEITSAGLMTDFARIVDRHAD